MPIGIVQDKKGSIEYIRSAKALAKEKEENITDYKEILTGKIEELHSKIKNGETENSYQIGAQSFTENEWEKLLGGFDKVQREIKEMMEEKQEKAEEKRLEEMELKKEEKEKEEMQQML